MNDGENGKTKTEPDAETYGIVMLNKAICLNEAGQKAEAIAIINTLIDSKDSTASTRALAKEVQKTIKK